MPPLLATSQKKIKKSSSKSKILRCDVALPLNTLNIILPAKHSEIHNSAVETPDLQAMKRGDQAAWDIAFDWVMPSAKAVAWDVLGSYYPSDVEDVALEALEEVLKRVPGMKSVDAFKPLVIRIAHNIAVDLLRDRFAQKRGSGKTVSLDEPRDEGSKIDPPSPHSALDELNQVERDNLLIEMQQGLKKEHKEAVTEFFESELRHNEIDSKHGWKAGNAGSYIKRGLAEIRKAARQNPKLLKEMYAFLRLLLLL